MGLHGQTLSEWSRVQREDKQRHVPTPPERESLTNGEKKLWNLKDRLAVRDEVLLQRVLLSGLLGPAWQMVLPEAEVIEIAK